MSLSRPARILNRIEVLGAGKPQADAEEFVKAGGPVGRLLEGQRRRDEIDLESPLAKPDRARLLESAAFGFFTQLEAGLDGLMDQGFGLGGGRQRRRHPRRPSCGARLRR